MSTDVYTTEESSVSTRKDDSPVMGVMGVPSGNLRGFGANSSDIPSGVCGRGVTPVPPFNRHPSIGGQIGPFASRSDQIRARFYAVGTSGRWVYQLEACS